MPESLIVKYCAPTLAGIKTANLFTCDFPNRESLYKEISVRNQELKGKGIRLLILGYTKTRALIYMYRPTKLKEDILKEETFLLLSSLGYEPMHMGKCLSHLMRKLKCREEFPHEIGCFLGYPVEDVIGFIQNRPCKGVGAWKVYGNLNQANKSFQRFEQCTEVYLSMLKTGKKIQELAVNKEVYDE